MKRVQRVFGSLFLLLSVSTAAQADDAEDFICTAVMCAYAEVYGGSEAEGCMESLDELHSIVKKAGSAADDISCPLTIKERIAWLSQCTSNTMDLEDFVNCD